MKRGEQASGDGYQPVLAASTKSLGHMVEIRIRDNGTGIPPEVQEKMFNPFFTTKPQGSGLGLAIVRKIVDAHEGRIDVRNGETQGTCFRVILPIEHTDALVR